MKFLFTFLAALLCTQQLFAQNIGIGTTTPHASAMLDVVSTNKGLLIPRVTEANRPASPATGLLIYQTNNTPGFYYYNGSAWLMLGGGSGFTLPYTGSTAGNALNITSTGGIGITGASSAASGNWYGGQFTSASTSGSGLYAAATAATGTTYGGQFASLSTEGISVYGEATSVTGQNIGGYFISKSSSGVGVIGEAHASTGFTNGVIGMSESSQGTGVWGHGQSGTGGNVGVRGTTNSSAGIGGYFYAFVSNEYLALRTGQGQVQFDALAGTGTRMVVANNDGKLSTQAIAGGQWVTNGNNIYNSNSGNVGVGANTPGAKLDVFHNGDIWHSFIGGSTGRLQFAGQNVNGAVIQSWNPTTNLPRSLYLQRDGGLVGIGTNAPLVTLDVFNNDGLYNAVFGGSYGKLFINGQSSNGAIIQSWDHTIGQARNLYLQSEGGNVGIGTISPTSKLDVFHNADIWHSFIGGSTGRLQFGGQAGNGAVIQSWNPTTNQSRDLYLQRDGGKVGIGTTSVTAKLDIVDYNPAVNTPSVKITSNNLGNALEIIQNGTEANGVSITNLATGPRKVGLFSMVASNANLSVGVVGIAGEDEIGGFQIITSDKVGVEGINRNAASGYGVSGKSKAPTGAGVLASYIGTGTGNALIVENGSIKVSGTNRPAFQVVSSAANTTGNFTVLSYPAASATDIVTVTPVWTGVYLKSPIGVFWNNGWLVFRQDEAAMPYGITFNVIVIKQ